MPVGPGVEAFAFSVGVEGPALREVALTDQGPQGQDGSGSGDSPPAAGDIESVGHQTTCWSFDDAAGDRPSSLGGLVVVEVRGVVLQAAAGPVRRTALISGQAQAVGFGTNAGDGADGAARQDPRPWPRPRPRRRDRWQCENTARPPIIDADARNASGQLPAACAGTNSGSAGPRACCTPHCGGLTIRSQRGSSMRCGRRGIPRMPLRAALTRWSRSAKDRVHGGSAPE